jgi:hypothetical protein
VTFRLWALGVGLWACAAGAARHAQERPLPDPDAFYRAVRDNLARAERDTHLYVYKERRTNVHTNPFGRLGTDGDSVYEVYPSPVRQLVYRRLVERDERAVGGAELSKQDGEYRARAARILRERGARSTEQAQLAEEESRRARERRERTIIDVVETLTFTMKERTTYQGVPAIVIAFSPKPHATPATRQGRVAQKFTGTIWIDERAAEVMHL